jgi:hypothetical protein
MKDEALTPETDLEAFDPSGQGHECVRADFARRLEVERNAYKKAKQENDERFMLERDDARGEVLRLRKDLDRVTNGTWSMAIAREGLKAARWREVAEKLATELKDYAAVLSGGLSTQEAIAAFNNLKANK